MANELASRPASMFDDSGAMKLAKTKAVLKNTLKVEMERRHASFLDGCAGKKLWVVPWPTGGTVQDFSTTSVDTSKVIWIQVMSTKLPSQKVVLTVSSNKKQLIDLILTEMIYHKDMLHGKLVITDNDPVPIQINQSVVSR